jgi:hypothetical protein
MHIYGGTAYDIPSSPFAGDITLRNCPIGSRVDGGGRGRRSVTAVGGFRFLVLIIRRQIIIEKSARRGLAGMLGSGGPDGLYSPVPFG